MRKMLAAVLAFACAWGLEPTPAGAYGLPITIALSGDPSPVAGFDYHRFANPVVSDAGDGSLAFHGITKEASAGGRGRGIFKESVAAGGSTVALNGATSPDGFVYRNLGRTTSNSIRPSTNASGEVVWVALLSGGHGGIYRDAAGTVTVVNVLGDDVIGVTGLLDVFGRPRIVDGTADIFFRATISGATIVGGVEVDEGLFRCSGGNRNCSTGTGTVTALVLKNDPVPDRPGREFCEFLGLEASTFGIAFFAVTKNDCADTLELETLGTFRRELASGTIETLALEGEPTETGGTQYASFSEDENPAINNGGTVAFGAKTDQGIKVLFICDPVTCPAAPATAAVLQGTPDPAGNIYEGFREPDLSDAGVLAFRAQSRGADGEKKNGMYVKPLAGSIETIALKGDPVPGQPDTEFADFRRPAMTSSGTVAFWARVKRSVSPSRVDGVFIAVP